MSIILFIISLVLLISVAIWIKLFVKDKKMRLSYFLILISVISCSIWLGIHPIISTLLFLIFLLLTLTSFILGIIILLTRIWFERKKISTKRKIAYFLIILVLIIGFDRVVLDRMGFGISSRFSDKIPIILKNEHLCIIVVTDKSDCYTKLAIAKNDISICDQINPIDWKKESCYIRIAEQRKDPGICEKLKSPELCYLDVAKAKKDISICDRLQDQDWRDDCYKEVILLGE